MKSLSDLAVERAEAGAAMGRPGEPWKTRTHFDLDQNAGEEKADDLNYEIWALIRRADEGASRAETTCREMAIHHLRQSDVWLRRAIWMPAVMPLFFWWTKFYCPRQK